MTLLDLQSRYPGAVTFRYGDGPALGAQIRALALAGRKTVNSDAPVTLQARAERRCDSPIPPQAACRNLASVTRPGHFAPEALILVETFRLTRDLP